MDRMLSHLQTSLEDPNHPVLGPNLRGLQAWGIWQPNLNLKSSMYITIHIFATMFVISQYVELWLIRSNLDMALRNLSVTMLSTVCVVKSGTFVFWQKYWSDIINFVSNLEKRQLLKKDKITYTVLSEYTVYCRRVTYFYWSLVAATVFTVILAPLASFWSSTEFRERVRNGSASYPEIMSSWVPFDRTRSFGYWIVILEHSLICVYGGGIVATYDTNAVVLMSFFAGQLKLLALNCERLFDKKCGYLSNEMAMKRIRDCHFHHNCIVKYTKIFNSLLSPVMFLYVIICSLMICASAIQLTTEGITTMQQLWISEYLLALIAQLFLYCWHGNEVQVMSNKVDNSVYKSEWYSRDVRVRKSVLLLAGQLRRSIVFKAGPFTTLTIATFVAILKGSYSYFTLLGKKDD